MTVRNGQNLLRPLRQPLVPSTAVTFWAMPIATRLVFDDLVCAVVTLLQVCAERDGTTCANVSECLPLRARQYMSPALQQFLAIQAEDIGDFQPMLHYYRRPSSLEYSIGCKTSASKELWVACNRRKETWRYLAVVRISAWPSRTWMVRRSAPASSMCVAQAWRSKCGWAECLIPALRPASRHNIQWQITVLFRGKQPILRLAPAVVDGQSFQHSCGENDVPRYAPFALTDMQNHLLAVDIG